MSAKIEIKTEIRDSKILKDVLDNMNIAYSENASTVAVKMPYHDFVVNFDTGKVSGDSDFRDGKIADILKNYQKEVVLSNANMNGHNVEAIHTNEDGSILIELSY